MKQDARGHAPLHASCRSRSTCFYILDNVSNTRSTIECILLGPRGAHIERSAGASALEHLHGKGLDQQGALIAQLAIGRQLATTAVILSSQDR